MPKASLAALIVNWNGSSDTLELLASLASCVSVEFRITCVVIDNASAPGDRAALVAGIRELRRRIPIEMISNSVNVGVPAAYNQAIQRAGLEHDYYLRLDNDVIVERDGLFAMIDALRRDRTVGAVGGNVRYYHDRSRSNGGAVHIDLVKARTTVTYPDKDVLCDGILGCIMLIPQSVIERYTPNVFLGKLFICTDESELSLRLAQDGLKTLYTHWCIGFHKGGASTAKVKVLSQYFSIRNWTYLRLRFVRERRLRAVVWLEIVARFGLNLARGRKVHLCGVIAGIGMWRTERMDTAVRRRHLGHP